MFGKAQQTTTQTLFPASPSAVNDLPSGRLKGTFMTHISFSCPKVIAAILGIIWASVEPTLPYAFLCVLAIVLDVLTAWRCNRRIHKIAPTKADGKLKSSRMSKVITDLAILWLCLLLADGVEKQLLSHWGELHLAQYVAAIFIAITAVSIAENESTAKNSKWATLLQRFIASKISRHTDLPEEDVMEILRDKKG